MITSANTSVRKIPALARKVDEFFGWKRGSVNIDIGAGKYNDFSDYLRGKRVKNFSYDPYNRSEEENEAAIDACPADTVTISDVLNVIKDKKTRHGVLDFSKKCCRKGGKVYISIYEGDKSGHGHVSKEDCWQEHRRLMSYFPEVEKVFDCAISAGGIIVCFNA